MTTAAFDYTEIEATALELCIQFGRSVTLIELDPGPSTPSQPWLGSNVPRTAPLSTKVVSGVFVEPHSLTALGRNAVSDDFLSRCTSVCIVATSASLEKFSELLDTDGSRWKITAVQTLTPGPATLLAYVGLKR
jgi:hypothetical protein